MHRLTKLFVLAACLLIVSSAFANKIKGPVASATGKHGTFQDVMPGSGNFQLPAVGSHRDGSLDEVIISENFDSYTPGQLPPGWIMVDVDNANCSDANWPFDQSEWTVLGAPFTAHSGVQTVANVYNDGAVPNNDWLILPQQNLTGEITLTFWAASQQQEYLETFAVKVSTTGSDPANFTTTLATYTNHTITWTEHVIDLSAYAGAPFYVGFHHTSVDEWIVKIDDVLLEAGAAAPTGTITGTVTAEGTGTPIAGCAVEVEGTALTATTNAQGVYTVNPQAGTYTLNFTAAGYLDGTLSGVVVVAEDTTTADVALEVSNFVTTNYPSAATPVAIPDQDPAGAVKTLNITDDFMIDDLDVTVNITHTYISDLDLFLVSPWGDTVQLAEDPTSFPPGANMTNCRFDDEAATPFDYTTLTAPFTGSWQPFEDLELFEGFSCEGTWTLHAVDNESADTGTIGIFTVHVTHQATAVGDRPVMPGEWVMHEAYPNPFNPSTQIRFDVPVTTNAELKIFNSLGQEVATLLNQNVTAGAHTVYFNAADLPSGLYFAQLRAGSFVSTQKLVLMK